MTEGLKIDLYHWTTGEGIGESIAFELEQLGHEVRSRLVSEPVTAGADIVFTYAPYGRWVHFSRQLSRMDVRDRPFLVHWSTEGLPPPHVPLWAQRSIGLLRSQFDDFIRTATADADGGVLRELDGFFRHRMLRYRYVGDYLQTRRLGIPFLLADISDLYTRRLDRMGIDCINVPFGTSRLWYADLDLTRDIDVLWIGSHGSWRRTGQLARIGKALAEYGIGFHVIDGRAKPFAHGSKRTRLLNRAKIVLNLMRTPYDDNTLRHFIAMPNRALVVSEPMLRHNTGLVPGVHYVEAPAAEIPEAVRHYLEHESERLEIVDRAYRVTTGELTMQHMLRKIISAASERIPPERIPSPV